MATNPDYILHFIRGFTPILQQLDFPRLRRKRGVPCLRLGLGDQYHRSSVLLTSWLVAQSSLNSFLTQKVYPQRPKDRDFSIDNVAPIPRHIQLNTFFSFSLSLLSFLQSSPDSNQFHEFFPFRVSSFSSPVAIDLVDPPALVAKEEGRVKLLE